MKRINGRYELQETIGSGGMGVVYKAHDSVVRRSVALKTIRDTPSSMALELFRKETTVLAAISHPNMIEIFDIGEFEEGGSKKPYFVMPLLPGATLDKTSLSVEQICDVILQTCRGLQAAHERGVIHRDLKPTNIFVLPDRSVKIIDFGVAHMTDSRTSMTIKGGTLPYMSPEQLDRDVAPTSDLFSLGVVFYEAVTRRHPFRFPTEEQTAKAIRLFTPPPAWELNQEVGQTISRIIHKCMAKQPHNRFATARDLAETIQKAQRNEPIAIFDTSQIQPRITRSVKAFEEGNLEFAAEVISKLEAEGHADPTISNLRKQIDEAIHDRRIKQLMESARNCLEAEEYALAQQKIDQVLRMDPSNNAALLLQGSIQNRISEEKIDEWLRLARQHLDNNAFAHARNALQNLLQLRPKETTGVQLLAEVDRREQQFKKTREEKSRLYQAAIAARKNGEMSAALTKMQRLIALDGEVPETSDPERGVEHQKFYDQVRAEHDAEQTALKDASRQLSERNFAAALALCDEFLSRYPGHPRFQALKIDVQDRQRQELSARIAETDRRVDEEPDLDRRVAILKEVCNEYPDEPHFDRALRLTRDKRDLVSGIVGKARSYEDNGQFNEALERWETLRTIHQHYPGLDFEINRLKKRRDEQARADAKARWVNQVDALLESGAYERALAVLENAATEFPADEELAALQTIARHALDRNVRAAELLTEGRELCAKGDVAQGLDCLRQAHEMDERNADIRTAYIRALLEEAAAQLEKNWEATEELSKQALNIDPAHPLARSLNIQALDRKREAFVSKAVAEARRLQAEGDFNGALARVEQALVSYPQEQRLTSLQTTVRKSLPDNASRAAGAGEQRGNGGNRPVGWTQLEERVAAPEVAPEPPSHSRTAELEELERLFATSFEAQDTQMMTSLQQRAERFAAQYPEDERFRAFQTRVSGAATQLFQGDIDAGVQSPPKPQHPFEQVKRERKPFAGGLLEVLRTRWTGARTWVANLDSGKRSRMLGVGAIGAALVAIGLLLPWMLTPRRVSVEIRAAAPGARVLVDGRDEGVWPARLQLGFGRHTLTAVKDGYSAAPQVIDVTRGGAHAFDIPMSPIQVAERTPLPPPPIPALLLTSDLAPGQLSFDDGTKTELEGQFAVPTLAPQKHKLDISGGASNGKVLFETSPDGMSTLTFVDGKNLTIIAVSASKDQVSVRSNSDPPVPVWLDGTLIKDKLGTAPIPLPGLSEGDHKLALGTGEADAKLTFHVGSTPTLTISAMSGRDVGTVVFRTGVPDANVFIDGREYKNKTNPAGDIRIPNRPVREYTIRIAKDDYEPFERKVLFKKGQQEFEAPLKHLPTMATLQITNAPEGAHVFIDNTDAGPVSGGTFSLGTVTRGAHTVEVRHEDYSTVRDAHEYKGGEVHPWTVSMRQTRFPVRVRGTPENAKVEYTLDGKPVELKNGQKVVAGSYPVTATAGGFTPRQYRLEVGAGKPNEVAYELPKSAAPAPKQPSTLETWTSQWKKDQDWNVVTPGGTMAPRVPTVIEFSVLLQGKRSKAGWYLAYRGSEDHIYYELSKDKLQRTVIVNGKKNKNQGDKREPDAIPNDLRPPQQDGNTIYQIRIRIMGTQVVHDVRVGGAWRTLDTWQAPMNLATGSFGFRPETKLLITKFE